MKTHITFHQLLTLLLGLGLLGISAAQEQKQDSSIKGKFVSTYEATDSPVCKLFTHNLNEFRHLPFSSCNPRLSPKFPEFSRPVWEEIPFDLELAEKVVKGRYENYTSSPFTELAQYQWPSWRDRTEVLRQTGQAHMWRTRIDFDDDGKEETIIRMVPPGDVVDYRAPDRPMSTYYETPPWSCDYNSGVLHMADDARTPVRHSFNGLGGWGNDIIYFNGDKRYFRVNWYPASPTQPMIERDVGGTAGVVLTRLFMPTDGTVSIGGPQCRIDWVPAKKQHSIKPQSSK